ncbi:MAG TPA: hypothetical protein VIX59_21490 [Candidatus Binataceae bacterium]
MLYDRRGRLLFSGGITGARGHFGDNAGVSAIVALIDTPASAGLDRPVAYKDKRVVHDHKSVAYEDQTAVYGCPLFAPSSKRKTEQGKCAQ